MEREKLIQEIFFATRNDFCVVKFACPYIMTASKEMSLKQLHLIIRSSNYSVAFVVETRTSKEEISSLVDAMLPYSTDARVV